MSIQKTMYTFIYFQHLNKLMLCCLDIVSDNKKYIKPARCYINSGSWQNTII